MRVQRQIRWTQNWWEVRRRLTPKERKYLRESRGSSRRAWFRQNAGHGNTVRMLVRRTKREIMPLFRELRKQNSHYTFFLCQTRERTVIDVFDA